MNLRATIALAGGMLAASLSTTALAQQGVNLSTGPVDYSTWTLLGSASANNFTANGYNYSVLTLTQGLGGESGAAYAPTALALDFNQGFQFDFNFYISGSSYANATGVRGDGMTFALTTSPALGLGGSGLGYEGSSPNSVALAVDTFHFTGDPVSPSLQVLSGGSVTPLAYQETGLNDDIRNAPYQWFGKLSYTPSGNNDNTGDLTAFIENYDIGGNHVTFSATATGVDFGALGMVGQNVHYGFTAGNGLADDLHATSFAAPVPEPSSIVLALVSLGVLGTATHRQRRRLT